MQTAVRFAKAGNRVLSFLAALLIIVLVLYGSYSLWDTWNIYNRAFVSNDLLKYKPRTGNTGGNSSGPTLQDLRKINDDVRGWLTIDNTHIDYPVVQGSDDMEYVNKDVYGTFVLSGSIFLSSDNSSDFTDRYNMVFGHHMDNGAMFGDIDHFLTQSFLDSHTSGTLYLTDNTVYKIRLFACVKTDAYDSDVYDVKALQNKDIAEITAALKTKTGVFGSEEAGKSGSIIAMSTCMDLKTNGRAILFGYLDKQ